MGTQPCGLRVAGPSCIRVERCHAGVASIGRGRYGVSWPPHRQHDCPVHRRKSGRDLGDGLFPSFLAGNPDACGFLGCDPGFAGPVVAAAGKRDGSTKLAGLFLAGLLIISWHVFGQAPVVAGLVHQEDSPYQQVRVRDDDLFRYLVLDRTWHAVMWRADPATLFLPYSQLMVAAVALTPEPKRGLILGHGGGSLAKWLAQVWPELELDVVEFDPVVVRMAERVFRVSPSCQSSCVRQRCPSIFARYDVTYDVIWVDAFARHLIPFHLTTVEFFCGTPDAS